MADPIIAGTEPPQPKFELWMEQLDGETAGATGKQQINIAPLVLSVTYADHIHGESDELEIEIDDFCLEPGNTVFKGDWLPEKGQGIELKIGYVGGALFDCGRFEVDEITFKGPPDTLTIRALNAQVKKPLRQDDHRRYENQTLLAVAQAVATRQGLTLIGANTGKMAAISLKRVTQNGEADLAFLKRLAEPYGYAFKVTTQYLVFMAIADLEAAEPFTTIDRTDLIDWELTDTTRETYKKCEVRYHDPDTAAVILGQAGDADAVKNDTLKVTCRLENQGQATARAEESLRRANAAGKNGRCRLPGHPGLAAGCALNLTGFQRLSGKFLIESSRHRLDRSGGYVSELEVRRV